MNRPRQLVSLLCGSVLIAGFALAAISPSHAAISIVSNSQMTTTLATQPTLLADLLADLPDLKSYLNRIKGLPADKLDLAELYVNIITLYKARGLAAVGTFLDASGLLDALHVPPGYLDLFTVYDQSGIDGLLSAARARSIINDHDELGGFIVIDAANNLDMVTTALQTLGLSTYAFNSTSNELIVGIPIDTLMQFQSPSALLTYVLQIAHIPHITGFRLPTPVLTRSAEPLLTP